jgi:hypothetical protein
MLNRSPAAILARSKTHANPGLYSRARARVIRYVGDSNEDKDEYSRIGTPEKITPRPIPYTPAPLPVTGVDYGLITQPVGITIDYDFNPDAFAAIHTLNDDYLTIDVTPEEYDDYGYVASPVGISEDFGLISEPLVPIVDFGPLVVS